MWPSATPLQMPENSPDKHQYGVFLLEEDSQHDADAKAKEDGGANGWFGESRKASTSLTFPGAFVEGFRDGNIDFNIPGVIRDTFSPPDDVHMHFKLPSDDNLEIVSDLECLTKAGEVMSAYWQRQMGLEQTTYDMQAAQTGYRSYFEGDSSSTTSYG